MYTAFPEEVHRQNFGIFKYCEENNELQSKLLKNEYWLWDSASLVDIMGYLDLIL